MLRGSDLPLWSARPNQTFRAPFVDLMSCQSFNDRCDHNHYAEPHFDTGEYQNELGGGTGRGAAARQPGARRRRGEPAA